MERIWERYVIISQWKEVFKPEKDIVKKLKKRTRAIVVGQNAKVKKGSKIAEKLGLRVARVVSNERDITTEEVDGETVVIIVGEGGDAWKLKEILESEAEIVLATEEGIYRIRDLTLMESPLLPTLRVFIDLEDLPL
jgi:predicted  nucleic acid-binding Zn-ribbon protein